MVCLMPILGWRNILVETEQIGGVVLGFDCRQTIPGRARVSRSNPCLTFVAEEVGIGSGVTLLDRGREPAHPRFMDILLLWLGIKCGQIGHDARATMGKGGGIHRHTSHRPT